MTSQEIVEDQLHHFESHPQVIVTNTNGILISLFEQAVQRVFCHYL